MKKKEAAKAWLKKAEHDFSVAGLILEDNEYADIACFHAHQAVEKALKAVLEYNNLDIPKIHDLEKLLNLVSKFSIDLKDFYKEVIILNDYYISSRYPLDVPIDYTRKETKQAVEFAKEIMTLVKKHIEG